MVAKAARNAPDSMSTMTRVVSFDLSIPTRSVADADAPDRMLGLPGGIGHAVAGQAGWNGAGGEADRRAPRIARVSLGGMEVGDLGAGKDASAALDRIREHSGAQ